MLWLNVPIWRIWSLFIRPISLFWFCFIGLWEVGRVKKGAGCSPLLSCLTLMTCMGKMAGYRQSNKFMKTAKSYFLTLQIHEPITLPQGKVCCGCCYSLANGEDREDRFILFTQVHIDRITGRRQKLQQMKFWWISGKIFLRKVAKYWHRFSHEFLMSLFFEVFQAWLYWTT